MLLGCAFPCSLRTGRRSYGLVSCQLGFNRTTLLSALRLQEVRVVKVPMNLHKGGDDAVKMMAYLGRTVLLLEEV